MLIRLNIALVMLCLAGCGTIFNVPHLANVVNLSVPPEHQKFLSADPQTFDRIAQEVDWQKTSEPINWMRFAGPYSVVNGMDVYFGDLSSADVESIRNVVAADVPSVSAKPITAIVVKESGSVIATIGTPFESSGTGYHIDLNKVAGRWKVESVGFMCNGEGRALYFKPS